MKNQLNLALQYILPQHLLSRGVGVLANSTHKPLKNFLIRHFIKHFKVDLSDANTKDIKQFATFNDFFIRTLKKGARPYPKARNIIASPVDGTVSQVGDISAGVLVQAKSRHYSLYELLGGETNHANILKEGKFATLYLSPADYHRVHMPIDGKLMATTYVPGKLFSVNHFTTQKVPNLFARNERLVMFFDSEFGPFVLVMVGAMLVASIVTSFAGVISPSSLNTISHSDYSDQPKAFKRGEELGYFQFGSTVILVFDSKAIGWDASVRAESAVKLGQSMAK